MINLTATNDKKILDDLSKKIFGAPFDGGVGYVLQLDDETVGVAKVIVNPDVSTIVSIGLLKEHRGKGYGDFFTRVLLNVLSEVSAYIVVGYRSNYFTQFGFKESFDEMFIKSKDIVFPAKCQHDQNGKK
ncbi:MAG TPA: GNAT family N-acetyltransferase [Clostridia bacterium]|jgi:GNAT superfamily N-acetyltransferase|nr:GNAT family N-acetyltransferase [Clostridia bacterium]